MIFKLMCAAVSSIFASNKSCYAISEYHTVCLDKSWNVVPDALSRKLDESFNSKHKKFNNIDPKYFGKIKYPLRAAKKMASGDLLIEFTTGPYELTQKEVLAFDAAKYDFVDKFLRNRIASGLVQAGFSNVKTEKLKRFDSKFRFIGFDIRAIGPANDPISATKYWLYTSNETVIISLSAVGQGALFPKNEISQILNNVSEFI